MASKIKVDQIEGSTGSTITIPTGQTFTVTDGIPVASGGTGLASFTAGDILYATGATTLAKLTKGTAEQVLAMNSGATAPDWGSVDLTVLPTITVAKGGTNISSFAAGDILYATGATTLTKLVKGSAADVLTMNAGATAPEWAAAAGGGKVLQVVSNTWNDTTSGTSSTFALVTGSGTSITPSATSSKILIVGFVSCDHSGSNMIRFKLYDSASEITGASGSGGTSENITVGHTGHSYGTAGVNALPYVHLYSPSTTSAVTINLYFASASTGWINANHGSDGYCFISNTTLYEIGA